MLPRILRWFSRPVPVLRRKLASRRSLAVEHLEDRRLLTVIPWTSVPESIITTVAGCDVAGYSGNTGQASVAEMNLPRSIALDAKGDLFIADFNNHCVREVNLNTGIITTVAGTGSGGYSGDGGQATAAELSGPAGVAVDNSGNLFIADAYDNVIREVNLASGLITTVAGNGTSSFQGDNGAASLAELNTPTGVAVDARGDLFIADMGNDRIREVNLSTHIITTVAGNGTAAFSGDGGQATAAELYAPTAVAVDASGDIFIADFDNHRVRKVSTSGVITTVAGNGTSGYSGDGGQATAAELAYPWGLTVDGCGDLYIADYRDNAVREVNLASGLIATAAGDGLAGYAGNGGSASDAYLSAPASVAFDAAGNLYIADAGNCVIREVASGADAEVMVGSGAFFGAGSTGLVWQNTVTGDVELWNQQGTTVTKVALGYVDPSFWNFVGVGNLDPSHPGNPSILLQSSTGWVNAWFVNDGVSGGFAFVGWADPTLWKLEGCGNFDSGKDAVSDLLWVNQPSGVTTTFIYPNGNDVPTAVYVGTMNPTLWSFGGIGNFDASNPSYSSVVWKSTTAGNGGIVAWLVENGTYSSIIGLGYADPTLWTLVGTGNLHNDATSDLLLYSQTAGIAVAINYPNGTPTADGLGYADPSLWDSAGVANVTWNGIDAAEIVWHAPSNGLVTSWVIENGQIVSQLDLGTA